MGRKRKKNKPPEIYTAALVKLEFVTHLYRVGQIPFEVYWQAKQRLEPEAKKELEEIRRWAVDEAKLITGDEWDELRRAYRDEVGDSFVHYLNALRRQATFITNNPKMLTDRKKLQKRFGGKIVSGDKFLKETGEAGKEALDEFLYELLGRPRPA